MASWGIFGPNLVVDKTPLREASWGLLGGLSGAPWRYFWDLLGRHGGLLGVSWGLLGASWGLLGGLLGPPGDLSGPRARNVRSGPPSGPALGAVLGASRAILEASGAWGPLGPSWALLEASWAVLGRSWGPLGPSWSAGKPKRRERQNLPKTKKKSLFSASVGPLWEVSWRPLGAS